MDGTLFFLNRTDFSQQISVKNMAPRFKSF